MSQNRKIDINLVFGADTSKAKKELAELQASLKEIQSYVRDNANPDNDFMGSTELRESVKAARELEIHLKNAVNVKTGKLDLSRLSQSLKSSNKTLTDYYNTLTKLGDLGSDAFRNLAKAITTAEAPTTRLNAKMRDFSTTLKNTIKWQISSSMIHGLMSTISGAYSYAQDLDKSLNNIRIVTGQSAEEMAKFAKEANKAAKDLSATTTAYTDASLIYYQQGLTGNAVKERTETTLKLSNVTGESAQEVSSYMTAIWNNFDDGSKSLEHYADVITALGASTASSSAEIAEGLEKFAAIGNTVGLSYEYATSALATVVAETRQSADVVGTAFKTLFGRIQGLKLGETLEDGTTLNKYSQALASVGVDIKDINGQIKNMDTILDELGTKWQSIGKDTQIALAQTVGGTRQYQQLVALMDNWSKVQNNLDTANNASGTLQKQQEIFEQSWEGSRKRLKASMQGVYDSLIDEKSFIKLNDLFSKLADGVKNIVDNFGGLKGIITTITSVLLMVFSSKIPDAIFNLKQNFKTLFNYAQKESEVTRQEMASILNGSEGKSEVEKQRINYLKSLNEMRDIENRNMKYYSDAQKQEIELRKQNLELLQEEIIDLQEKKKLEESKVENAKKEIEKVLDDDSDNRKVNRSKNRIKENAKKQASWDSLLSNVNATKILTEDKSKYSDKDIENMRKDIVGRYRAKDKNGNFKIENDKVKAKIEKFEEALNSKDIGSIKENLKQLADIIGEAVKDFEKQSIIENNSAINNIVNESGDENKEEAKKAAETYHEAVYEDAKVNETLENTQEILNDSIDDAKNKLEELNIQWGDLTGGTMLASQGMNMFGSSLKQIISGQFSISTLISLISGLTMVMTGFKKITEFTNSVLKKANILETDSIKNTKDKILGLLKLRKTSEDVAAVQQNMANATQKLKTAKAGWLAIIILIITALVKLTQFLVKRYNEGLKATAERSKELTKQSLELNKALDEQNTKLQDVNKSFNALVRDFKNGKKTIKEVKDELSQLLTDNDFEDLSIQAGYITDENDLNLFQDNINKKAYESSQKLASQTDNTVNIAKKSVEDAIRASAKSRIDNRGGGTNNSLDLKGMKARNYQEDAAAAALTEIYNTLDENKKKEVGALFFKNDQLNLSAFAEILAKDYNGIMEIFSEYNNLDFVVQIKKYISDNQEAFDQLKEAVDLNAKANLELLGKQKLTEEELKNNFYETKDSYIQEAIKKGYVKNYEEGEKAFNQIASEYGNKDIDKSILLSGLGKKVSNEKSIEENEKDELQKRLNDYKNELALYPSQGYYQQGAREKLQNEIDSVTKELDKYKDDSDWEDLENEEKEAFEWLEENMTNAQVARLGFLTDLSDLYFTEIKDIVKAIGDLSFLEEATRRDNLQRALDKIAEQKLTEKDILEMYENGTLKKDSIKAIDSQASQYSKVLQEQIEAYTDPDAKQRYITGLENTKQAMENEAEDGAYSEYLSYNEGVYSIDYDKIKDDMGRDEIDFDDISNKTGFDLRNENIISQLNDAIKKGDFSEYVEKFTDKGYDIDFIKKYVEEADDASKALKTYTTNLNNLSKQIQDAKDGTLDYKAINESLIEGIKISNVEIDNIQKSYKTLSDTMKEYAENGYISLDSFQSLIDLSPSYLECLEIENGKVSLNTEAMKDNTEALAANLVQMKLLEVQNNLSAVAEGEKTDADLAQLYVMESVSKANYASIEAMKAQMKTLVAQGKISKETRKAIEDYINTLEKLPSAINLDAEFDPTKGSNKKDNKKHQKDEVNAYHNIERAIKSLEREMKEFQALQSTMAGDELVKSLKYENELLEEQAENYRELNKVADAEIERKQGELARYGVSFNTETGEMANYIDIYNILLNKYNEAVDTYNNNKSQKNENELNAIKEAYDEYKNLISAYDTALDKKADALDKLSEIDRKIIANNLKGWETTLKIHLDLAKAKQEWAKFNQGMDKDLRSTVRDFGKELANATQNFSLFDKDTLAEDLRAVKEIEIEIEKIRSGEGSDKYLTESQAAAALLEYSNTLREDAAALHDLWEEAWNTYLEGIDDSLDKWDELIDKFDYINSRFSNQKELISILYGSGDFARDLNAQLNTAVDQNNISKMNALNEKQKALQKEYAELMEQGAKETDEDVKKITDAIKDNELALEESINEYLQGITDTFTYAVETAMRGYEKALTSGGSFDWMSTQWEDASKAAEGYYDDVEKIYELQSIESKWQNLINDTSTLKNQQRLKAIMDSQLENLENKTKLSEYDIGLAEKELEIAKARIALEDAQNNKTSMKLVRDTSGNWSYQYMADEDEVNKKQEEYLNALHEKYEYIKSANIEVYESLIELQQEFSERYIETITDVALSEEQKAERLEYLQEYYWGEEGVITLAYEKTAQTESDLNNATAEELWGLYEVDVTNYETMTQKEQELIDGLRDGTIRDYEEIQARTKEINEESLLHWQTTAKAMSDAWNSDEDSVRANVEKALELCGEALNIYEDSVGAAEKILGTSFGNIGKKIGEIADSTKYANSEIQEMIDKTNQISKLRTQTNLLADSWENVYLQINAAEGQLENYLRVLVKANEIDRAIKNGENTPSVDDLDGIIKELLTGSSDVNKKPEKTYTLYYADDNEKIYGEYNSIDEAAKVLNQSNGHLTWGRDDFKEDKDIQKYYENIKSNMSSHKRNPTKSTPQTTESNDQRDSRIREEYTKREIKRQITEILESSDPLKTYGSVYIDRVVNNAMNLYPDSFLEHEKADIKSGLYLLNSVTLTNTLGKIAGLFSFDTGGYTGDWSGGDGRLAMLHSKELVLNKEDTHNILEVVDTVRQMTSLNSSINNAIANSIGKMVASLAGLGNQKYETYNRDTTTIGGNNTFEITMNVDGGNVEEIQQAILNLPNLASQFLSRR